jgi:hypothetical protein
MRKTLFISSQVQNMVSPSALPSVCLSRMRINVRTTIQRQICTHARATLTIPTFKSTASKQAAAVGEAVLVKPSVGSSPRSSRILFLSICSSLRAGCCGSHCREVPKAGSWHRDCCFCVFRREGTLDVDCLLSLSRRDRCGRGQRRDRGCADTGIPSFAGDGDA